MWKSYAGTAVPTRLTADIDPNAQTIPVENAANWPAGGILPFVVKIDGGTPKSEKKLIQSRAGNNLIVAQGGHGFDGGGGIGTFHSAQAPIVHSLDADTVRESNHHVYDVNRDDHTQYLNLIRHAAILHTVDMLGPDSVGSLQLQDASVLGVHVADLEIADNHIASASLTERLFSPTVAGAGLAGGAGVPFAVAVDGVGIEIPTGQDYIALKAAGVLRTNLNADVWEGVVSRGTTLADESTGTLGSFVNWSSTTLTYTFTTIRPVSVLARVTGNLADLNLTAGSPRNGLVLVAISYDGGANFTTGMATTGTVYPAQSNQKLPISAGHWRTGTPTGAIVVKAQVQQSAGPAFGMGFTNGFLDMTVLPA